MVNKKQGEGLPWWRNDKESTCQCRRHGLNPLIWGDPTYCGFLIKFFLNWYKPVCHNYCACAVEPGSRNYWNGAPESADAPKWEKSLQWEAQALQLEGSPCSPREKSPHSNEDAAQPKINNFSKKQREIHLKTVTMKTENGIKHATLIITQHPATGNKEERKPRSLTCITFSARTVDWKKKKYVYIYVSLFSFPITWSPD